VRAAGAGLVVGVEAEAVASGLDALLADPAKARAAGEAGRQYVRTHLGWDGIARQIESMYRSCLS
jgi:starch synthase